MKKKFFEGSPNEILGQRRLVFLPSQKKEVWAYLLKFQAPYYVAMIESSGDYVKTKYVVA